MWNLPYLSFPITHKVPDKLNLHKITFLNIKWKNITNKIKNCEGLTYKTS